MSWKTAVWLTQCRYSFLASLRDWMPRRRCITFHRFTFQKMFVRWSAVQCCAFVLEVFLLWANIRITEFQTERREFMISKSWWYSCLSLIGTDGSVVWQFDMFWLARTAFVIDDLTVRCGRRNRMFVSHPPWLHETRLRIKCFDTWYSICILFGLFYANRKLWNRYNYARFVTWCSNREGACFSA